MASAIVDYLLAFRSISKEKKRIKEGQDINQNLTDESAAKVAKLKAQCEKGNTAAMYQLGTMYLNADGVGYDPDKGEKYLLMAAKSNDFDVHYALALFYRGHWSYQHVDAFKSMEHYMVASHCKTDDARYLQEVNRAIKNDFGTESTKAGLQVWFKVDIPIK